MALISAFWARGHLYRGGDTVLRPFPLARRQDSVHGHSLVGIVGLLVRDPAVMRDQSVIRARYREQVCPFKLERPPIL